MTQWSELRLHDGGPCPVGEDIPTELVVDGDGRLHTTVTALPDCYDWSRIVAFRVRLPEPSDMQVPWHVLPKEYRWAAVDNDGEANAFSQAPHSHMPRMCWTVGATFSGRRIRIDQLVGYDPGTKPWDQSLIQRPEGL